MQYTNKVSSFLYSRRLSWDIKHSSSADDEVTAAHRDTCGSLWASGDAQTHNRRFIPTKLRRHSSTYRCYVVCGTAALHGQASTAAQQMVFENSILNIVQLICSIKSESVAVRRALFEFDPVSINKDAFHPVLNAFIWGVLDTACTVWSLGDLGNHQPLDCPADGVINHDFKRWPRR